MKMLYRIYRVLWIVWSIVITATLILLIAALVILEYRSWRAIDPDKITFMPAPNIYAAGIVNPFDESRRIELRNPELRRVPAMGVLFQHDGSDSCSHDLYHRIGREWTAPGVQARAQV